MKHIKYKKLTFAKKVTVTSGKWEKKKSKIPKDFKIPLNTLPTCIKKRQNFEQCS